MSKLALNTPLLLAKPKANVKAVSHRRSLLIAADLHFLLGAIAAISALFAVVAFIGLEVAIVWLRSRWFSGVFTAATLISISYFVLHLLASRKIGNRDEE